MEVYEFDKTFENRISEYRSIFDDIDSNSSSVDVSSIWATYLSDVLQRHSWTGVWSLSLKDCYEYSLLMPASMNVSVEKINYRDLTAFVRVHPADGCLAKFSGERVEIALKDLYVAKEQESDAADFAAIADSLDKLRIFYHYLVWPWEEDAENAFAILTSNIENRLKLYYDITDGVLSLTARKRFIGLISRAKKTYELIRLFVSDPAKFGVEKLDSDEGLEISMNLYNNLAIARNQLRRWTDEKIRKCLDVLRYHRKPNPSRSIILQKYRGIRDTASLFSRATKLLPQCFHKTRVRSLSDALISYETDETIFLSPGVHVTNSARLDWNVTIRGLYDDQKSAVGDESPYWYVLKITGDNVILRDLTICLRHCQVAIFLHEGVTELDSVLFEIEREAKSAAIVVDYNASLVANRCQFVRCDVAIVCLPGSATELSNCIFESNEICLQIFHGAQVCMVDCDLSSSKIGSIEYHGGVDKNRLNTLDSLSSVDSISFRSVRVRDESKAVLYV